MSSNNKLFQMFLRRKAAESGVNLRDNNDFIAKTRDLWKSLSESERLKNSSDCKRNEFAPNGGSTPPDPHFDGNESNRNFGEELEQKLIDRLIKYKTEEELKSMKMYFMSSNVLCFYDNTYPPLEIGLVEYSIGAGIESTFHSFINAGTVPLGYMYSALNHSHIHKIPIENFVLASNQFYSIGTDILQILANSRPEKEPLYEELNSMIVFSIDDQIEQNIGALEWLSNRYRESAKRNGKPAQEWNIRVVSASNLLLNLYLKLNRQRAMTYCRNQMTSTSFDYSRDTDCPYHESLECIECALGVAKRMAYNLTHCLISDKVLKFPILSTHFPIFEFNQTYRYFEVQQMISGVDKLSIDDQSSQKPEQPIERFEAPTNALKEPEASDWGSSRELKASTSGSAEDPKPLVRFIETPKKPWNLGIGRGNTPTDRSLN